MGDIPADNTTDASPSSMEEISGKMMVAAIIGLFMVIVFVCFLHLYARWFWSRRGDETHPTRQRRRRFVFAPSQDPVFAVHRGLEPSVVRSLPIVIFHANDFKDGLECAVCLCDLEDGEKARLLPNCNHGFHVECIDMWFQSHSTCPLCRDAVGVDSKDSSLDIQSIEDISGSGYSIDSPDYPTNVLFWGNQTQFSTRGGGLDDEEESAGSSSSMSTFSSASTSPNSIQDGGLVIEIPRQIDVLSSASPSDEMKSPIASPMMTRLRSFRRLLSREKRVIPNSPTSIDVELGEGGAGQSSKTSSES